MTKKECMSLMPGDMVTDIFGNIWAIIPERQGAYIDAYKHLEMIWSRDTSAYHMPVYWAIYGLDHFQVYLKCEDKNEDISGVVVRDEAGQ